MTKLTDLATTPGEKALLERMADGPLSHAIALSYGKANDLVGLIDRGLVEPRGSFFRLTERASVAVKMGVVG